VRWLAPSVLAGALAVLGLAVPAGAGADVYGPIELVSQGFLPGTGVEATVQANYAHDPTISLDGRYVAFDGSYAGRTGVWRRDIETGEISPVAVGRGKAGECQASASGEPGPCDAVLPSISENGQYVSFTTAAPLAQHEDSNAQPDVYVRNMDIDGSESNAESAACVEAEAEASAELVERCPFTLVSAVDGKDEGLAYGAEPGRGSLAEGRSAISASGQQVAFVTSAVSNLAGPGTPAMQVAVRDLGTRETQLVSTGYEPATGDAIPDEPVSGELGGQDYGGAYDRGTTPEFPIATGAYTLTQPVGASISADGSTVAWLGVNIGEQTKVLPGESFQADYAEPLWRRTREGPLTPTRRITGGSDPEDPACAASGEQLLPTTVSASDPCQGPFVTAPDEGVWNSGEGDKDYIPQLSSDGYTVALLATAPLVALGNDFGFGPESRPDDVYVVDMHPGLTRVQALRPLSEFASGQQPTEAQEVAPNAPIIDVAISPDGTQIAFTTKRTEFPLGVPTFISAPAAVPGLAELFVANLSDETLTRVTQSYEGGATAHPHGPARSDEDPYEVHADDGALSPSFGEDGNALAFSSTASNIVYGDGNTPAGTPEGPFDGADAFVVHREVFAAAPTPQEISSAPAPPAPALTSWMLGASALSLANGTVELYVQAPARGSLLARAQGHVLVRVVHAARRARDGRRAQGRSARAERGREALVTRTLASAATAVSGEEGGLAMLTLKLLPSFRALAFARGGLSATVTLTFTAPGHAALHQSLEVSFIGTAAHASLPKHRAKSLSRPGTAR